jgi:hypothetical protein
LAGLYTVSACDATMKVQTVPVVSIHLHYFEHLHSKNDPEKKNYMGHHQAHILAGT